MANAVWPGGLPQNHFLNLTDQRRSGFAEFAVDTGPAMRRIVRRGVPRDVGTPFKLNQAQRLIFDEFFVETLEEGTLPFDWIDPVTLLPVTYRFLTYPQWTQNPTAEDKIYEGSLSLEILP